MDLKRKLSTTLAAMLLAGAAIACGGGEDTVDTPTVPDVGVETPADGLSTETETDGMSTETETDGMDTETDEPTATETSS